MRKSSYTISYFICPDCGNAFPLPRNNSIKRNKGHIKDLYCICCRKTVKAKEVRNEDFYIKDCKNTIKM